METYLLDANVVLRFLRRDEPTMAAAAEALFVRAEDGEVRLVLDRGLYYLKQVRAAIPTRHDFLQNAALSAEIKFILTQSHSTCFGLEHLQLAFLICNDDVFWVGAMLTHDNGATVVQRDVEARKINGGSYAFRKFDRTRTSCERQQYCEH